MSFNQATPEEISAAHDLIASFGLGDRIEVDSDAYASDIEADWVIWVQAWIRVPAGGRTDPRSYGEIEAASWEQLRPIVREAGPVTYIDAVIEQAALVASRIQPSPAQERAARGIR